MAITWGTEVKNSTGNGMRVGYEFSQSPSSVGTGTSSVTVTCRVYVWTRRSVFDSNNSYSITGSFSGSGSVDISHGNNGGTTLIRTLTRTVTTSYSGSVSSSVSVSLTGIAPISGTARVSGSWNTGKRPITSPDDHSSISVSRSSDTRQNVSWGRVNPTATSKPYQSQELRRMDVSVGTYKTIANLTAGATSYADSSTTKNNQYRYAIRAKNSAGVSSFVYSDYISTTPNAPTGVKAVKSSGNIRVTWVNTTGTRITAIEVWLVKDGVVGTSVHAFLTGSPTSWTHTNPDPGSTWAYRIKTQSGADVNDAAPNLYSGFSTQSNTVQLLTNPAAPTKLAPSSGAHDALDADLVLTWQHNSVDSSEQTGYDLRYRLDSGAWTTVSDLGSPTERKTFPAGTFENGQQFEWQVRTYGDYAVAPAYSAWSTSAIVTLSARPAVTITEPEPLVASSRITARWSFFDPEGSAQTAYRVRLESSGGTELYDRTGNGSGGSFAIPVTVADGGTYTVYVSARDGNGMWSYESGQTFAVDYAEPPTPTFTATWDLDLGGVVVTIEHPEPTPEEVPVVSAELWRSANGEDWALVAADLDPSTSVVDFIPALDAVNYYRVTSVSALPSRRDSASRPVVTDSKGWVFVNGGPGFGQVAKIRDNASANYEVGRARARHHFAGRTHPMETTGEARTQSISLSARIGGGSSTVEEWEAIADLPAPLCYRDRSRRVFVGINPLSSTYQRITKEISMSFEKVDHIE